MRMRPVSHALQKSTRTCLVPGKVVVQEKGITCGGSTKDGKHMRRERCTTGHGGRVQERIPGKKLKTDGS